MICGFTAKTTASGASASPSSTAERCAATSGEELSSSGTPPGSMIAKREAAPLLSQPRSIADPIWPQPTRTTVPALMVSARVEFSGSGFADRVDHRRGHRFVGRLAAPHDQLERRVEPLAFRHRDIDEILDLLAVHAGEPAH